MKPLLLVCMLLVVFVGACSRSTPPAPPTIAESRIAALLADRTDDHGVLQAERARGGLYLDVFYRQGLADTKRIREGAWYITTMEDIDEWLHAADAHGVSVPIRPANIDSRDYVGGFHLTPVCWESSAVGPCHQTIQTAGEVIEIQRYPVRIDDIDRVEAIEVRPAFWDQLGLPALAATKIRVSAPQ